MRICTEKATGKLIEMQEFSIAGTLTQNALNAGYAVDAIEEREITDQEWADILAIITSPSPQTQADEAAIVSAKTNAVIQYLVSHTPAECAAYIQANVTNLSQAKDMLANYAIALSVLARNTMR